ncbi:hypothetical protein M2152_000881 [Microbacteriaceae bacterium SG_E_30_P1]|uniref:LysM domain-containing protein n=1 Tax=Antiquaquibacter oligotrophicus TaxID=2880260 RepID=A0ABT6KNF3_9MICO|nr:LysM peptidoglycan-binding domain-containing protein [Antiquaquibacter oligotrophicus]MDH6180699.1 hypothetical protein [Antiquaquibacter oligotrophicus]UDF13575.1 LysM peptidoglycan-binding domain-containing protein [Antiquaquibacter oligotrophicus]
MSTMTFPSMTYSASVRPAQPRLRITRRGRRVLFGMLVTPVIAVALAFAINGGGAVASLEGSTASFDVVTVETGESLWQVAESVAPTSDPREVIDAIVRLNRLESADVYAGQQLTIPLEYAAH